MHVSCKEAVDPIARAREQGWDVWGETCTQYFFIDYTYLERPDFEGAKYVYTPPPRSIARTRRSCGTRCARTSSRSISTDHCAFLWDGQKSLGRDDFSKIPNGGPGLENRLHMIHEFGVRDRPDLAEPHGRAARDEPGEALRPLPAKGHDRAGVGRGHRRLRPGARHLITAATQHSKVDYNLYEGTEVTGSPELVMLRGNVLVESGEFSRSPVCGEFVERAAFGQELLPAAAR